MAEEIRQTKRKETKYFVNYGQYVLLSTLLKAVLNVDPYANDDGFYFVRSLYFDTLDGKDCQEKEIGISHRRKIRLRYYEETPTNVKLEVKEKVNHHTLKKSIKLSAEEAMGLFEGNYDGLMENQLKLYDHMKTFSYRPSSIVDYEREAYVSDLFNIRINFDMNVRGSRFCENLFDKEVLTVPLIEPGMYVLEVKHDGHIPDFIQEILAQVSLTQVSYSKYFYSYFV